MPLRRCKLAVRPGRALRSAPCAPAQLGCSLCPCAGGVTVERYRRVVDSVRRGLTTRPSLLLEPLHERMATLAAAERFEEAADVRDRTQALAHALHRQQRAEQLRRSGIVELDVGDGRRVELHGGRLLRAWSEGELALGVSCEPPEASDEAWLHAALADELACVAAWLDRNAPRVRLVHCEGVLASPLPAVPVLNVRK
jgi:DNA polymerase-3 subunit epsilon